MNDKPLPADVAGMREACAACVEMMAADKGDKIATFLYEIAEKIRALPIPKSKTDAEPEPIGWYVRCPETGGHLLDTEKIGAERKARECYHPREYHILPVFLSAPSKTDAAVKALVEALKEAIRCLAIHRDHEDNGSLKRAINEKISDLEATLAQHNPK